MLPCRRACSPAGLPSSLPPAQNLPARAAAEKPAVPLSLLAVIALQLKVYIPGPSFLLQLGSFTKIKVSTFPRDLLDPMQSRCGSLPGQHAVLAPRCWPGPLARRAHAPGRMAGGWLCVAQCARPAARVTVTIGSAHQHHPDAPLPCPLVSLCCSGVHAQELDHAQAPHPQLQLPPVSQGEC